MRPAPFPHGIETARRPTGPILGIVVVVACVLLGQLLGAVVLLPLFGLEPSALLTGPLGPVEQLVLLLSSGGPVVLLALWIGLKERRRFGSVGFVPASRVGPRLGLGVGVAVLLLSLPVALNLLTGQYEVRAVQLAQLGAALLALLGFAVQASTEEVLIRGYLLQVVRRGWGLPVAMGVQAVVFTALHGANAGVSAVGLVNILLVAALLGFWALAEGGLWGVCAFHVVWNWLQGNGYGIEVSGMDIGAAVLDVAASPGAAPLLTGGDFGVEGSLITTVVLLAATALAARAHHRRTPLTRSDDE
ncbi:type II CAAX endopeptidase family protein [Saccharopolyspora cebuensis]|uniref:Type II CAAX endopeptidase family protein n=1 Tax=Saccharopolyspora cebuensis TaxID=418759 RepID=A0ABV4CMH0_9PSEU